MRDSIHRYQCDSMARCEMLVDAIHSLGICNMGADFKNRMVLEENQTCHCKKKRRQRDGHPESAQIKILSIRV